MTDRELVLTTTAPVPGGAALSRDDDGRVVFVDGALPGEEVRVRITSAKRDFARADVVEVVRPSPDRVTPPCPHVARGCGGCDLQHVGVHAQPGLKVAIVVDALRRQGRIDDPKVGVRAPLPDRDFRTTIRAAITDGQAGYRARRSHEVVTVDSCLVAHPVLERLLVHGDFGRAREVTLRIGASTGEVVVIVDPSAREVVLPEVDAAVTIVGTDELRRGASAVIHEDVLGARFRVSARSFFQSRPDGAAALVETVRELGGAPLAEAKRVVDAYAGVGLFAALAAPAGADVIAVESSASSVADARVNLEALRGRGRFRVRKARVEAWNPEPADVVIADPARTGLGRDGAARLAGTDADVLVLVSCDAAALGRDAGLLEAHGYRFQRSVLVDLFPHTHHVEVVSRFVR